MVRRPSRRPSPTADGASTLLDVWGDGSVPLLAKLLAAGSPLSLQVHPDADTAVRWWSDGEARALLADQSEKTEMLVALDPSWCWPGGAPRSKPARCSRPWGASEPVLAALVLADHAAAVRLLLGDHPVSAAADAWDAALTEAGGSDIDRRAMAAVVARFGADPGSRSPHCSPPTCCNRATRSMSPPGSRMRMSRASASRS